ncbi:MAG: hypothetical protein H0X13_03220 [Ramlibacter sp.]|nr:hypothetical protein [Ramlibacter sp.]
MMKRLLRVSPMNESPAFQKMKAEGRTSKAPLTESPRAGGFGGGQALGQLQNPVITP